MDNIKVLFLTYLFVFGETYKISSPIIWESSNTPVIRGIQKGLFISYYQDPCDLFVVKPSQESKKNNISEQTLEACRTDFQNSFIKPLKTICKFENSTKELKGHNISKRGLPILVLGGIAIVVSISGVSIGTAALVKTIKNDDKIENLEQEVANLEKEALALRNMNKDEYITIKDFNDAITSIQKKLDAENIKLHLKLSDIHLETYSISSVVSQIQINSMIVIEFIRYWKQGKIYPKMFDVLDFNIPISTNNPKIDPLKFIFPKKCIIDELNKKIILHTMVYNVSEKFHVLEAKPFTLIKQSKKGFCLFNYKGPKLVLYNDDSECIVKVTGPLLNVDRQLTMEPKINSFNSCDFKHSSKSYGLEYWESSECYKKLEFNNSELFQIVSTPNGFHVYCYTSKIKIGNVLSNCPNDVIYLTDEDTFEIDEKLFGEEFVKISTVKEYSSRMNHLANLDIFGDIGKFYGELNKKMSQDIRRLDVDEETDEKIIPDQPNLYTYKDYGFWILSGILLCILANFIVKILKKYFKSRKSNQNGRRIIQQEDEEV